MKRKNATRSALFTSIISLLLCVSMLVGTTFAWFTDEVKSGTNLIAAGNLDVELYNSVGIDETKKVSETTPLFEEVKLWEPGVVAYENLTVANVGTLALKYQMTLNITGENTVKGTNYKLSDVLKIAVVEGGVKGTTREAVLQEVADSGASWETLKSKALSGDLTANTTAEPVGLVIYWQPTANDNNWNLNNGKTTSNGAETLQITLGINLFATQLESESDSFDKTYDKDAALEIPEVKVETPTIDAFLTALEAGETAVLTSNLTLDDDAVIPANTTSAIDLNGYTLTVGDNEVDVNGNLIITATNGGSIVVEATQDFQAPFFVQNGGHIVIEAGNIVVNGGTGVVLYDDADMTMTGGSITANNGQDAVKIIAAESNVALLGGSITTDTGYVTIQNSNADVVINGTALNSAINHLNSNLAVTYYGDTAPNVVGQSEGFTVTIRKGTAYEGITQSPENAKQYYIESKAGLMNLNALFADVRPGEGNIIKVDLTTDIDLTDEAWSPINSMWVTFNGNGHTISNLTAGLSTDGRRSGFWGYAGAVTINDLTLENVTVSGSQVGTFVGAAEGTKINNCFLKGNNTVNFVAGIETWNGIGAISGVLTNSNLNVEIIEGATVALNTNGMTTDSGCTYVDDLTGYIQPNQGKVTNSGTVTKIVSVATSAELLNAINNATVGSKNVVELADGTYADDINLTLAALKQKGDLVFKAAAGANPVIAGTVTLGYRNQGVGAAMWNSNVTFEGITFDHANAATHSISVQDVKSLTLKNCTIIGDGEYGIDSARGNGTGASLITGCTFKNAGMQLLGNFATGLVIEDCTFNESRINVQAGNGVTVQDCTFNATLTDANVGDSFYLVRSNSTPITVIDCEIYVDSAVTGVATEQAKWGIFWNRGTTNWTVSNVNVNLTAAATSQTALEVTKCTSTGKINATNLNVKGVATVSSTADLTAALNAGNDVILTGTVDLEGKAGNSLNLTNDTTITGGAIKGTGWTGELNYAVNATSGNIVFDGVTFDTTDWTTEGWANWGICVNINGTANVTFKNCNFTGTQCPIYLSGSDAVVTLENCTFESTVGAIQCEIYSGDFQLGQDLIVKNCDFTGMADVLHIYDYDKNPTSEAISQYLTANDNTFTGTCKQTCS